MFAAHLGVCRVSLLKQDMPAGLVFPMEVPKEEKSYVLREDPIAVCKATMLVYFTYVNYTSCGDGF